jgi:head-tail adaptor
MPITNYYSSIEIHVKTATSNGRGGSTYAWAKSSTIQGLINQASSREIEAAAKLDIHADYKLYCGVSVALDSTKLLYYGGEYYRVVSKPKNTVNRNHHLKILLKQVSSDEL